MNPRDFGTLASQLANADQASAADLRPAVMDMDETPPFEVCSECAWSIRRCERLQRQLRANLITLDEYAYNALLALMSACDTCTPRYLDLLPDAKAAHLDKYLQVTLETEGYLPFVRPFVVNFNSEDELRLKSQENEPIVNRLRRFATERATRIRTCG